MALLLSGNPKISSRYPQYKIPLISLQLLRLLFKIIEGILRSQNKNRIWRQIDEDSGSDISKFTMHFHFEFLLVSPEF